MKKMYILCFICGLLFCGFLQAGSFSQRQDVQNFISKMNKEYGFNKKELAAVMNQVKLQPKVIESITAPYEQKSWNIYKQRFLRPDRVAAGKQFWQKNRLLLEQAEKKFFVPAAIIVSIVGVETFYGKNQGNYRVLDSLATLAFNYPPRSAFFTKELGEFLLLCREQGVAPTKYLGSYAGAIGMPQFMPSSYRYYAADFSNKKIKDLMTDNAAIIASVANYLHKHGWRMNEGIAEPAKLRGQAYKKLNTSYKKAVYSPSQLMSSGITSFQGKLSYKTKKIGLVALNTQEGKEYWLAYPNFYVITSYNSSPLYAMAVYLLAKKIAYSI